MNLFNRALDRVIAAREEQAQRFVDEFNAEHGYNVASDMSNDLRG
nr:hypothetical protein [uncultured Cohaesibacter sp.]